MKNQLAQTDCLFRDRPLPETPRRTGRSSALHLAGFDRTDYVDSTLRAFLALCLLGSLAVCGREWTAPSVPAVAKTATVQHVHALADTAPRACRAAL